METAESDVVSEKPKESSSGIASKTQRMENVISEERNSKMQMSAQTASLSPSWKKMKQ